MNIDLSKFKKIDCDDKCTVLLHPSGHEIKVAHEGLSPELKKQLDELPINMAKGGYAKYAQKYDPNVPKKTSGSSNASKPRADINVSQYLPRGSSGPSKNEISNENARRRVDAGRLPSNPSKYMPSSDKEGFTEPQAQGVPKPPGLPISAGEANSLRRPDNMETLTKMRDIKARMHTPPCINPSCKSYGRPHPNCRCYGGEKESMYFSEGGEVETYCSRNREHENGCEYFAEGGSPGQQEEPMIVDPPVRVGELPPEEQQVPPPAQEAPAEEAPSETAPATPEQAAPAAQLPVPGEAESPITTNPVMHNAHKTVAALSGEDQKMKQDLDNGHITPKTYQSLFENSSTPAKIGTLFGLLVGGIGSGLNHQPNVILGMMDNEINNDIKAQEASATNKQNFKRIANETLKNMSEVTGLNLQNETNRRALEYASRARAILHQQVQNALNLPEGSDLRNKAMQALTILSPMVDKKIADQFSLAGLAQATSEFSFGGGHGNQANTLGMKSGIAGEPIARMGQDIEDKTIDNVPSIAGQRASRPVPQAARDQIQAMNVLNSKAHDLISYAKAHEGTWNPKTRAIAQQKAEEMIGFYNNSVQGGVLTEGRLKWLDEQIKKKNPTSVIAQELLGSNERLNEIKDSNSLRQNMLLKSYGFHPREDQQSKPKKVVQNGHTYHLNPKTGKYE